MTRAYASSVLQAPLEPVWNHLRDFSTIDTYLPTVELIEMQGPPDRVGCVRAARHRETGQVYREKLIALSDAEHSASYTQLEFPMIDNCVITVGLRPITTSGATFIEWYSDWDLVGEGSATELADWLVHYTYELCFQGLEKLFGT